MGENKWLQIIQSFLYSEFQYIPTDLFVMLFSVTAAYLNTF